MSTRLHIWRVTLIAMVVAIGGACVDATSLAQESPAAAAPPATAEEDLAQIEARLADRFNRLETLVERLAELSRSTQPRRATLLRQLIAQSRDRDVAGQFERVVAALEQESYSSAIDAQSSLETELQRLLELLLQEDRDRQIESDRKRIGRYLQDVNRLIRQQRGIKARTDGGDDRQSLTEDQEKVAGKTKELGDEIDEAEQTAAEKAASESPPDGSPTEGKEGAESKPGDGAPHDGGEPSSKESKPGESKESDSQEGESKPSDPKPENSEKPTEPPSSDDAPKPSESGKPGEPSDGKPSEGQPSPGKPSQGSPPQPSGEPGQPGQPGGEQPPSAEQPPDNPMQRAAQRLRQAQQQMELAQKKLEESKQSGALEEQSKAVEELEQAKAELERILRQLREEELERMLVMLEARFRKMLDEQIEVYDETKKLDAASDKAPAHELEIASGRLARQEGLIVREADRALVLLREDGTSTAFPEAIEQARDDMQSIAARLRETRVDLITQGLEEDVIAALEETLAALQQALKDLREQKGGQPQQGGGQPGEKPLVDQLAELRMIRSLQVRVNRRTQQYGAMIDGEQALEGELLEALDNLSIRQQKIFQATRELNSKEN